MPPVTNRHSPDRDNRTCSVCGLSVLPLSSYNEDKYFWVSRDLCSACATPAQLRALYKNPLPVKSGFLIVSSPLRIESIECKFQSLSIESLAL